MPENKSENRRQNLIIFLCWLVYTAAYLARYSYNSNITLIMDDYNVSHAAAGLVTTFFFFAYGAGQIINGCFCGRYPKKQLIPIVFVISGVLNFAIYLGVDFALFKYMWLINGFAESTLWCSLILVLSQNLDDAHLSKAIIIMSSSSSIGTFIIYGLSSLFASSGHYRLTFLTSAIVLCIVAVVWLKFFRPVNAATPAKAEEKSSLDKRAKIPRSVIIIIAVLAVFAVVSSFTRDGLQTWVPSILKETYNLPDSFSLLLITVLNLLGIVGTLCASLLHKFIKNFIALTTVFFIVMTISIGLILATLNVSLWPVLLCFGIIILATFANTSVITSMAPLYLRNKINSGMIAGILDGFCYLGSTISSYGLGIVADGRGWNFVFVLFLVILTAVCVFGSVTYALTRKQIR